MEGIETPCSAYSIIFVIMSVGAPTWRGLKRNELLRHEFVVNVSRCPDMEGIETPDKQFL